jgi:hypothetical protein
MPGTLHSAPVTDEQRRANDTHSLAVVLAVVGVLVLHAYLLTPLGSWLALPTPQSLLAMTGLRPDHVFGDDGLVDSLPLVGLTDPDSDTGWRLFSFYAAALGAFLCAYFLPLRAKRPALLPWTIAAVFVFYGIAATAGLLCAHAVAYLTFHPKRRGLPLLSFVPGALGYLAFAGGGSGPGASTAGTIDLGHLSSAGIGAGSGAAGGAGYGQVATFAWIAFTTLVGMAVAAVAGALVYRLVLIPLLARPRIARIVRALVAQSALLIVCVAALIEGRTGFEWAVPLGLLLFFWQWARLMLYHVDYKDGLVPEDTTFVEYLSIFLTPGVVPIWNYGVEISQGYAYTVNNFLCEKKNKIVMGGVRLLLLALLYMSFCYWGRSVLVRGFATIGLQTYEGSIGNMIQFFADGKGDVGTLSVLATTMITLIFWTMAWAGVLHAKVGLWRICGYRVDPYFDKPWLGTNLVVFWTRYTYHYREYMVRAFYYPVFFRFFRKNRELRIVFATMVAAGLCNMIYGHLTEEMFYGGAVFRSYFAVFRTWPYYLFLGAAISLTELYLFKRGHHRRRPWTRGPRVALDVLAVYCTVQFYAMIHIFMFPTENSTIGDLFRLFLRGFGIRL